MFNHSQDDKQNIPKELSERDSSLEFADTNLFENDNDTDFATYNPHGVLSLHFKQPISLDLSFEELLETIKGETPVQRINDSLARILGAESVKSLIENIESNGGNYIEVFLPDSEETLRDFIASEFNLQNVESKRVCFDGTTKNLVSDIFGVVVENNLRSIHLMLRDVTPDKLNVKTAAEKSWRESEQFKQDALDSLSEHVAILDESGNIVVVNEAWRRFARENEANDNPRNYEVGANYLDVCEGSHGERLAESRIAYDGIRAVLGKEKKRFSLEYPCRTAKYDGWFLMTVTPSKSGNGAVVSHFDITQRKQIEADLRESRLQFQQLTENINSVFWIYNWRDKETEYLSPAFESMWGFGRENLAGHHQRWLKAVHDDDRNLYSTAFDNLENSGKFEIEYRIRNSEGKICWICDKGFFIKGGELQRATGVREDFSERKELELERERLLLQEQNLRVEAEATNRLKDEFLATVSHELRTPLTSIVGWTQMLLTGKLDEKTARYGLETVKRNANSQSQLIEDLLDVSRIVSGSIKLEMQPLFLEELIEASIESHKQTAEAKQVKLISHVDSSKTLVYADAKRVRQILWSLLSNALKFTPRNGRVDVYMQDSESHIKIRIQDDGIGIREETLPHIFERFRQADGTTTRKFGGLGLGLSVVRYLAELHGGSVEADSDGENLGAIFTVKFPKMDSSFAAPHNTLEKSNGAIEGDKPVFSYRLDNVKLLLVDDDRDNLDFLTILFERLGASVRTAMSANDGLEKFQKDTPDVLISDIGMPDGDGFSLIKRIRSVEAYSATEIPAIALTAFTEKEDVKYALQCGFQRHIKKPAEPDELVKKVAELLRINH